MADLLPLPPGEVHLWYVVASEVTDPSLLAPYEALLAPEERERRARYYFDKYRHEYPRLVGSYTAGARTPYRSLEPRRSLTVVDPHRSTDMTSRTKRLVWSLGVTLSMGVALMPLGCESSGPYASILPSHRGASVLPLRTPVLPLHRGTSALLTYGGHRLPKHVVDALSDCVKQAPAPSTSAEGNPRTYSIQFDAHVTEEGDVSAVEVRGSMLGGDAMEACLSGVLRGASLPVRAQATQRAPEARALMGQPQWALPLLGPVSANPVVLVGVGFIVVVGVTIYIITRDPTDEDREKERCKKVLEMCIEKCTEETIPTGSLNGDPFFKCRRKCLEAENCWGVKLY